MFDPILKLLLVSRPWAAWLWTFLILVACSLPGKNIPAAPLVGFDKIVHIGMFFIWINLWLLKAPNKRIVLIALGMAFGIAIEYYQQLLPFDRSFDWWDALADAVGILLGYFFKTVVLDRYLQRLY